VIIIEAMVLAASLSIDAFAASFAYGSAKVKIPFRSVQVINIVCSSILGLSLLVGAIVRQYLPGGVTTAICFGILFVLGIMKLLDGVTKSIVRKYSNYSRELRFSMFNFRFILSLYADPEKADVDQSRSISPVEAFSLALALSLDGLAVGFGAALGDVNVIAVICSSLVANTAAVMLGTFAGNRLARKIPFDLSWISGVIILAIAVTKLF